MDKGFDIAHPLKREGTYRFERFPEPLAKDYFKPDERNFNDYVKQAAQFAQFVKYYNDLNFETGNWSEFFEEIYDYNNKALKFNSLEELESKSNVSPHLALFLAFIKIYEIARDNLNTLTQKHLDFYYKTVLQLKPHPEVPDKAILTFETEKNASEVHIPENTKFKAGKDKNGKDLLFKSTTDLIVNQAKIEHIKNIFVEKNNSSSEIKGIYANTDVKTINITENLNNSWFPFGNNLNPFADIGFAIASPLFNLREGKRRITFIFEGLTNLNREALKVDYTTEKGWAEAEIDTDTGSDSRTGEVPYKPNYLLIQLQPGDDAVLPYNDKIHQLGLNTPHPVFRFRLTDNPALFVNSYKYLNTLRTTKIDIIVQVSGVKNLKLQNDFGELDNTKPFLPFGPVPVKSKSTLYIGCFEAFNKYLTSFNLAISWKGLPGNIRKYYKTWQKGLTYIDPDPVQQKKYFDTEQFENFEPGHPPGEVSILDDGKWKTITLNQSGGYSTKDYYDPYRNLHKHRDYTRNVFKKQGIAYPLTDSYIYNPPKKFDHSVKSGFVKIILNKDFGHQRFQRLITECIRKDAPTPEIPYTPEFNHIHLDYTARAIVDFNEYTEHQFIHIHPFGFHEVTEPNNTLISGYIAEGNLLIGIKDLNPGQSVSILFQMDNDTGNIEKDITPDIYVKWHYLEGNQWVQFSDSQILSDTTTHFKSTGIIRFSLPKGNLLNHTILPPGFIWLKASTDHNSDAFPRIIDILSQAAEVIFENNTNELSHLSTGLAPQKISKPVTKINGIKSVKQPFTSFDGKSPETDIEFYTRVSERLRHKHRAWNIWDYERLTLHAFTTIYKVKCIPHANTAFEYFPGNISLILISGLQVQANPLKPRVNRQTIEKVKQYLAQYSSIFVKINVSNPDYEELTVKCSVKLHKEYSDAQYYRSLLITEIKEYIAPWLTNASVKPSFEGKVYKSHVINFIEERHYVDYILEFDITMLNYLGITIACDEIIAASKEHAILTSAINHQVTII